MPENSTQLFSKEFFRHGDWRTRWWLKCRHGTESMFFDLVSDAKLYQAHPGDWCEKCYEEDLNAETS